MLARYPAGSPSDSVISAARSRCSAGCRSSGGASTSIWSRRSAVSSPGTTSFGAHAFTIAANAKIHCFTVAPFGRCPTRATNRLFSASEPAGARSDTSNPASSSERGIRAGPYQRVLVLTSNSDVFMAGALSVIVARGAAD